MGLKYVIWVRLVILMNTDTMQHNKNTSEKE
jgi:hypothetical protein